MDRSVGRDVHIYDANTPVEVLGGLILTDGVTNGNFYQMIEILFIFESPFSIRHESGNTIQQDQNPLQRGNYYIQATGSFSRNDELWLTRALSQASGTRTKSFRDAVHIRDRGCAITGQVAVKAYKGDWTGFHCAHIFPLAYEQNWTMNNFNGWITLPPVSGGSINSVQNGMLLRADIHHHFDNYQISISPDDKYKIICFDMDGMGIAGRRLDRRFLDHPDRPVDQVLRWHFRQAVLANMRGAGEPVFEADFSPGSDIAGEIRRGPKAAERMEFELFTRLADFVQDES